MSTSVHDTAERQSRGNQEYIKQVNLQGILEQFVVSCLKARPTNVIDYMHHWAQQKLEHGDHHSVSVGASSSLTPTKPPAPPHTVSVERAVTADDQNTRRADHPRYPTQQPPIQPYPGYAPVVGAWGSASGIPPSSPLKTLSQGDPYHGAPPTTTTLTSQAPNAPPPHTTYGTMPSRQLYERMSRDMGYSMES